MELKFKGIKGNWRLVDGKYVRGNFMGTSYLIATVRNNMPYPVSKEMCQANANLIAAAPDLLNACKQSVESIEWAMENLTPPEGQHQDFFNIQMNALESAKQAIEKALK